MADISRKPATGKIKHPSKISADKNANLLSAILTESIVDNKSPMTDTNITAHNLPVRFSTGFGMIADEINAIHGPVDANTALHYIKRLAVMLDKQELLKAGYNLDGTPFK